MGAAQCMHLRLQPVPWSLQHRPGCSNGLPEGPALQPATRRPAHLGGHMRHLLQQLQSGARAGHLLAAAQPLRRAERACVTSVQHPCSSTTSSSSSSALPYGCQQTQGDIQAMPTAAQAAAPHGGSPCSPPG
jgi:hypothetical protein